MDRFDKQIVQILTRAADTSATEIGRLVELSVPAVNKRIRRLKEDGTIRRFTVLTDPARVGRPITAYILLVFAAGREPESLPAFLSDDPDVLECYAVTGEYDYLVKVAAGDIEALEDKLLYLKKLKGVVKSHTMLALREYKHQPTALPSVETDGEG